MGWRLCVEWAANSALDSPASLKRSPSAHVVSGYFYVPGWHATTVLSDPDLFFFEIRTRARPLDRPIAAPLYNYARLPRSVSMLCTITAPTNSLTHSVLKPFSFYSNLGHIFKFITEPSLEFALSSGTCCFIRVRIPRVTLITLSRCYFNYRLGIICVDCTCRF